MAVFVRVDSSWADSLEAGQALSSGDNVCIKSADGKVYKADADDSDLRPCIGAVDTDASSGDPVTIITQGVRNDGSSLTKGALVYLSTTAGAETQTGGSGKQAIGVAISDKIWYFQPQLSYNIPTA